MSSEDFRYISETYSILSGTGYMEGVEDYANTKRGSDITGFTQTYHLHFEDQYVNLVLSAYEDHTTGKHIALYAMNIGEFNQTTHKVIPNGQFTRSRKLEAAIDNTEQIVEIIQQFVRDARSAKSLRLLGEIDETLKKLLDITKK
jgi:hypothetical protein